MVVTSDLNNDLIFVLLKELEVFHVGVAEPHWMAVIASPRVHMLNYHELATLFSMLELVSQPEHLLYP